MIQTKPGKRLTNYPEGWIQDELNKRATEGWELVAPVVREGGAGITLIFRQEAR